MKKGKIFSILLTMLLFLGVFSLVGVKAETSNSFDFIIDGGLEGAENSFTLTSSKGIAYTKVSGIDMESDVYVSIKFASKSVTNLDVFAYDGATNSYTESAYKVTTDNKYNNLVEFQSYYDSEFTICTVNITEQVSAITEITYIKYVFRGTSGDTLDILDFVVTTDGVHGFDTTSSAGGDEPVVPEVPVESDFNFVAVSGATGENNVFEITGSDGKGYVETEVSNVDLSSTYVSIKLTTITNLDIYVSGTDATGAEVVDKTVCYKIQSGWNKTEYETYGDGAFTIMTAKIDGYFKEGSGDFNGITTLTKVKLILRGVKGDKVEILDFAVTTDGVHGFDTTVSAPEQPDTPVEPEPVAPTEFEFTSGSATVDGNKFTLTGTYGSASTTFEDLPLSKLGYVSVKYRISGSATFETYVTVNVEGGEPVEKIAAGTMLTAWNGTNTIYDEFSVFTFNINDVISGYDTYSKVKFSINGAEGDTLEILDFAITKDGNHGFELPMVIGAPKGDGLTVTTTEEGYELSYNNDEASWRNAEILIENYKPGYDSLNISLYANKGTNIQIDLYYGASGKKTLRSHYSEAGVVLETGQLDLVYSLVELGLENEVLTKIVIYLDNPVDLTTNTGPQTVKLLKCEVLSLAKILAEAKEAAKAEIVAAIGSYEISSEAYVQALEAAETLEALEVAKKEALEAIATEIATIEEAKALAKAKEGSILLLKDYIAGYEEQINISEYVQQIEAASSQADVKTIFNTAKAYVLERIEQIDAENSLIKTKADAKKALASYKEASLYREAEQAQLQAAIEAGNKAIEAAANEAAVEEALSQAKAVIDGLKTKAQYEAEEAEAAAKALAAAKTSAKEALVAYKEASLYREAEQTQLQAAIEAGNESIEAAANEAAVEEALSQAKAVIDGLKTKAQYEDEEAEAAAKALAAAKTSAKEALASYKEASLYREAEQAQLQAAIEAGNESIEAAANEAAVEEALSQAKAVIDGLKTKAQYEAEEAEAAAKALAEAKAAALAKVVAEIGEYAIDKASYETAINAAETVEAVETALQSALTDIKTKKTEIDEQNKPQDTPVEPEPTDDGCFGALVPSILGMVTLLGACLVIRKRRKE